MKRTLVVQTAFLGDLVLTQPLIAELARVHGAVDVFVRAPFVDLAKSFAGVANAIPFDKRKHDRGLGGLLRRARELREARYDQVVIPHKSFRTGLVLRLGRIPTRIGFKGAPGAVFYTKGVADPRGPYPDRLRGLSIATGAGPGAVDPVLEPRAEAIQSLDGKLGLPRGAKIAAINPGSVWGTKRWLAAGYGEVCVELERQGWVPVITGGPEDIDVAREVARAANGAAVDLAGRTDLLELVALAKRASIFVSGDSGPMHIAAAVGTPVVAIFGPTTPSLGFAPRIQAKEIVERALDCRPCHAHGPQVCPLGHFRCMREIPASDVLAAIGRLSGRSASSVTA